MPEPPRAQTAPEGSTPPEGGAVRITGLASDGAGIGRLEDGRVVFVEGAVPGDEVELVGLELRKRMARARIGRLVRASADRVTPRCPHFGACGGCEWQHVRYPVQLEAKRVRVRDALVRIGGFPRDVDVGVVPSPDPYAYRARARLVERDGHLGYRRRGSHEIEPVATCPVLRPALEEAMQALAHELAEEPEASRDATRRARSAESEWILSIGTRGAAVRHHAARRARDAKDDAITLEVLGESLRAGSRSFVQGNALLWDELAALVRAEALGGARALEDAEPRGGAEALEDAEPREVAHDASGPRFLELYAGIGFFTLPLARQGLRGVAIESDRSAFGDLRTNLDRAGLASRVEIVRARVERRDDLAARCAAADVLVADPPRAGLEPVVREAIERSGPARLVYVSCDPATLARDLAGLREAGYRLSSVRAVDLFPQTPHVEVVAALVRD
jgi:23S rRNA (uracil1939-C5)-methyltransferase